MCLCVPLLKRVEEIQTKEARSLKQREKHRERESRERVYREEAQIL